ncbi:hypothetical protein EU524_01470 [Candidatus Thorarchaeota archaeon]|nr:MAG: hypothetical protein EU524_01470 [Candidatus Thorarchaeota archaeon]
MSKLHTEEHTAHNTSEAGLRNEGALNVQLVGESILYSVFKKGSSLTTDVAVKLESMFLSALKKYDRAHQANAIGTAGHTAMDVAVEMFTQLATSYVELLVGVIPPEEHGRYFSSPEGFCKAREAEIPGYVRRKLMLLTLSSNNSFNLSKALTKLIRAAAAADIRNGRFF